MKQKQAVRTTKREYNDLLSNYLQGRASVADLRRLNDILGDSHDLAKDFDAQVRMNSLLNELGRRERMKPTFEEPPEQTLDEVLDGCMEPDDDDTRIPLIGPDQPQAVVCVFVSGGKDINPHMLN